MTKFGCDPGEPFLGPTTSSTDYIGNFVYINGHLDHIIHPQGILRPTPSGANNTTEFVYDFFIKDYLGNVRVVLTEEDATYTQKFLATMDSRADRNALWHSERRLRTKCLYRQIEEDNFDQISETAQPLPPGYPVDGSVAVKLESKDPMLLFN